MAAEAGACGVGRVVALQANFCRIALDAPGPAGVTHLLCTRRTRLGKSGQQICVGDRVRLEGIDWPAGRGAVAALEPRHSLLGRPAVANVARVVVVVALAEPELDLLQLTRFLLTAELSGCAVDLVLSKADLRPPAVVAAWCERLRSWGYEATPVSSLDGAGLESLRCRLQGQGIAVLCGPSGVGKSSLLNALAPELALRVGAVSGRLRRGRHTTRHVELFPLAGRADGTLVADTPGFNRPELPVDPQALASLFPEIRARLAAGGCRYSNCSHQGDPGCAVGTEWDRHPLYVHCLTEVLAGAPPGGAPRPGLRQRGDRQEPLLDPQLRQPSRRRGRQALQDDESLSPPDPAG